MNPFKNKKDPITHAPEKNFLYPSQTKNLKAHKNAEGIHPNTKTKDDMLS